MRTSSVDLPSGELTGPGCILCWEHEWPKGQMGATLDKTNPYRRRLKQTLLRQGTETGSDDVACSA
jgi:hypothetical protein